jgi:hypothetical protein
MSKPVTVAIAGAFAIALLVFLALNRDKRSIPAPDEHSAVIEPGTPQPEPEPAPAAAEPAAPEPATVNSEPQPSPPAAAVARPTPQVSVEVDAGKPLDEQALLSQLHDLAASDPPLSLKLARAAVEQNPNSPNAPEFEWNVVKALFNMRQLEDAENEARVMLAKYPDSSFTGDVVRHLLNHPPNPDEVPPEPP